MSSRKQAFITAVAFTAPEIQALWQQCPSVPTKPRKPNLTDLDQMLISKSLIADCLGASLHEVQRSLRGASPRPQQLRFDAFMERLTQEFQTKRDQFSKSWSPEAPVGKIPKSKTQGRSTALAIRKDSPYSLVDASDLPEELELKMGWNPFSNIAALSRASGVCKSTLMRMRDGLLVRKSSREKILVLSKLSSRTLKLRLRPA